VFTEEPTDVSADKGQVVKLTCAADGSPAPSYIWYRNSDINQVQAFLNNSLFFESFLNTVGMSCGFGLVFFSNCTPVSQIQTGFFSDQNPDPNACL
jgi:Immunoglobulin domain